MFISFILLVAGIISLIYGANLFITGSVAIARRMKVSPLMIGLTIVALGTSVPEFAVNITSSLGHHNFIPIGNIMGSNIVNTLFIFAVAAALTKQFSIKKQAYDQSIFYLLVSIGLFILAHFPMETKIPMGLPRYESILFILCGLFYFLYLYKLAKRDQELVAIEFIGEAPEKRSDERIITDVLLGLIFVIIGGKFTMDAAVNLAYSIGISEGFIALSFVAIGTSLPELVTSIVAVRKRQFDLLMGNLIGSNIINTLLVLGVSLAITPLPITTETFHFIFANMIAAIIFVIAISFPQQQNYERWKVIPFIAIYFLMLYVL